MNIYAVKVPSGLASDKFHFYLNKVSLKRRTKIVRYKRQEDAIRSIFGELLLYAIVEREKGIGSDLLSLSYTIYGKPYFREISSYHFNISHSGCWVIVGTDSQPIGVDIQLMSSIELDVAEQFFSIKENQYLNSQLEHARLSSFYDLWTLKEAYLKAIGKGLSVPLNSFTIGIDENKRFVLLTNSQLSQGPFWFKQFDIDPDYRLSVCSMSNSKKNIITKFDYNDLVPSSLIV
ncbi:4'-phosphopantetheinyl transferase [Halobacillus karajensis]|uniref:4'-phosphopantetheinyl transferase family protein n=1 Tax=Halobacillus karajensis TaxID=195088 RepID=UPI0008A75A00|nr:4'-phosphopantetheinyl transferase superfamily protein [Halobacillus karajensis]SEH77207.1 4'-phosphopantetheinyl transferase [Halobacillus karajensis]